MENRITFKFKTLEYEVVGTPEVVERERRFYFESVLPMLLDLPSSKKAMTLGSTQQIEVEETQKKPEIKVANQEKNFSRSGLTSFIKPLGDLSQIDLVLVATYFNEKKNADKYVTSTKIRAFFQEMRLPKPTNPAAFLYDLAKRGDFIENPIGKSPKSYILSSQGIQKVEDILQKNIK